MRARDFLLEYRRDITAKNLGDKLYYTARQDRSIRHINMQLFDMLHLYDVDQDHAPTPQEKNYIINAILSELEARDPTPNKQYTQWLARMYIQDTWYLEDLNRNNWLGLYDLAKRRNMLRPEHRDINQFRSYGQFEDTMMDRYDPEEIDSANAKKITSTNVEEIYDGSTVRVLVPKDQDAACYYGRGTRWCTAATRGKNFFDTYSGQGPLYILLPKNPQHPGEKYQLHFATYQFMDEEDHPKSLYYLLTNRFPELLPVFKKIMPGLNDWVVFADENLLQSILDFAKKSILDTMDRDGLLSADPGRRNQQIEQLNKALSVRQLKVMALRIGEGPESPGPFRIIDIPELIQKIISSAQNLSIYGVGPDYFADIRGDRAQKKYYVVSDKNSTVILDAHGKPTDKKTVDNYLDSIMPKGTTA
jgi:hypothetical protein